MRNNLPDTMRCWRSGTPGLNNLELANLPLPIPHDDEALVRISAAALNFSDLLMIDDRYQVLPPRPFTPGQEISGAVVVAGERSGLAVGDVIASKVHWGGFAEYAVVRGDMAIRMPPRTSLEEAAALPVVYTSAIVALTESTKIRSDDIVLVLAAAGGVGLACVEVATRLGARVIAAAGGEDKCALARQYGALEAVDYREENWSDVLKSLTNGQGVDVIVDPVGGPATSEALRALAWEGRLLVVGFSSGEIPRIPANRLLLKRASAIGVYWSHDRDAAMLKRVASELTSLMTAGAVRPHIGARFAFNQLPQALSSLAERRSTGKLLLIGTDEEMES